MCSKRDGAHGEIEAGIHGQVGRSSLTALHATLTDYLNRRTRVHTRSSSAEVDMLISTTGTLSSTVAPRALQTHLRLVQQ